MKSKYFNNKKTMSQAYRVRNRRDADKLISGAYEVFLLFGIMALRNKFEFGNARIERWIDEVNDLWDSYNKGFISLEDLKKTIKEETGVTIEF